MLRKRVGSWLVAEGRPPGSRLGPHRLALRLLHYEGNNDCGGHEHLCYVSTMVIAYN